MTSLIFLGVGFSGGPGLLFISLRLIVGTGLYWLLERAGGRGVGLRPEQVVHVFTWLAFVIGFSVIFIFFNIIAATLGGLF